jgi:hypothetical protein
MEGRKVTVEFTVNDNSEEFNNLMENLKQAKDNFIKAKKAIEDFALTINIAKGERKIFTTSDQA